jgi:pyruvate/2-oxoacid:ferredoxin oxidoreductase beta subunit
VPPKAGCGRWPNAFGEGEDHKCTVKKCQTKKWCAGCLMFTYLKAHLSANIQFEENEAKKTAPVRNYVEK